MMSLKRLFFISWMFLFVFFLPLGANGSGEAEPVLKEVADGVYVLVGAEGGANSGFVVTEEGVIVIDTQGPKDLALLLKKKISEVTDRPVIYVINTHYHGDHTFGNQYFKGVRDIIAHENTRKNLVEKDEAHRARFKRFFGEESLEGFSLALPTSTFSKRFALRVGNRTIIIFHPGTAHTDGDIFVVLLEEKVLFAGDILYRERLPWVGEGDTGAWLKALDDMLGFGAEIYVPGHGPVGDRDTVEVFKNYLIKLRAEVKRFMDEGKGLDEIKKEIKLTEYKGYRKYKEWLSLNAEKVYREFGGE